MICKNNDFRIEDHKRGTTWYGMSIVLTEDLEDGTKAPVNLTGANVIAEFSKRPGHSPLFKYSIQEQTLVFGPVDAPNPLTGEILFKNELIDHPAYDYYLCVYVQFPNSDKDPILEGYWNITN